MIIISLLMLWRYTRFRSTAEAALIAETGFRRAMENSMSTGMRVPTWKAASPTSIPPSAA